MSEKDLMKDKGRRCYTQYRSVRQVFSSLP